MEWYFKYIGPKLAVDERDCAICNTVARKRCLTHSSPTVGCAHCDAVRNSCCAAHCGIAAALAHHNIAENDPLNFTWVATGQSTGQFGGGAQQERRETKMTQEKADRIRKASAQFASAGAFILAQCALLPDCRVDVTARGDDLNRIAGIDIAIVALGGTQVIESDEPEVESPPVTGIVMAS